MQSTYWVAALIFVTVGCAAPKDASTEGEPPVAVSEAPAEEAVHAKEDTPTPKTIADLLGSGERFAVQIDGQPCRGAANALVTLVEFGDYSSPFVRRIQPTVARLLSEGKSVRHCFRNFPVRKDNPLAGPAAEAAEILFATRGNEAFWTFHERQMSTALTTDNDILAAASGLMPEGELVEALQKRQGKPQVASDYETLGRLRFNGIPVVFINGRPVKGAVAFEQFSTVLAEETQVAEALVKAGVGEENIYATVISRATRDVPSKSVDPGKPRTVNIQALLISSGGLGHPPQHRSKEEARQVALSITEQLRSGSSFESMVRKYSNAGDSHVLGPGKIDQHYYDDEALNEAAFDLDVGEIVGPIETDDSFHFFKRVE